MGMTMTQKILAAHAGLSEVKAGQLIEANLDMVLGNDITSPVAINEFERCGADSVFDKSKISLVMDHFVPNKDIKSAEHTKQVRTFAAKYGIEHFYDVAKWAWNTPCCRKKGSLCRRRSDWRGFPYLHLWRAWGLLNRRGLHGYGRRHDYRQNLV